MYADSCSLDARLLRGEIIQETIIRRLSADVSVIVPPPSVEQGVGERQQQKNTNNIDFIYINPDWRICLQRGN